MEAKHGDLFFTDTDTLSTVNQPPDTHLKEHTADL